MITETAHITDANGKEMSNGDIVKIVRPWPEAGATLGNAEFFREITSIPEAKAVTDGVIIGNVRDNPEFLKPDDEVIRDTFGPFEPIKAGDTYEEFL